MLKKSGCNVIPAVAMFADCSNAKVKEPPAGEPAVFNVDKRYAVQEGDARMLNWKTIARTKIFFIRANG